MHTIDLQLNLSFGSNAGFMRVVYSDKKEILSLHYYVAYWDACPCKIPVSLIYTTLFEGAYELIKAAINNNVESGKEVAV